MTFRKIYMVALLCLLSGVGTAVAATKASAELPPKREIRAAWLTTVWAIDWPKTRGTGADVASKQQAELRAIIDKMYDANMNTVFFQVRGFSDAMYKSSYEPWSIYLTGGSGEPTYDPLAYAVEYAHSKGMELHAWVNPYRYSTSQETYSTAANSYSKTHPEWLMNSDDYTVILNPGIPEVRDQIARVITEIVKNYDIDGVLFDDYFYINGGTKDAQDAEYYKKYNPDNLTRGDWRRQQVNLMVRQVHDAIKAAKPYCRFGISPAGVAATNKDVAAKYGVEPAPVSSDWQYNGIYSDPLAWLSEQSIDYISPQIYWPIGAKADYDQLCNWWSKVANKFGRHFYSSMTLSDLEKLGNQEFVDEVNLNRAYDRNGATGSVFYSLSNALNSSTFLKDMKEKAFTVPALPTNMAWYPASSVDYRVSGITLSGRTLRWTSSISNVRYAVYALPQESVNTPGVFATGKYLVGMSYRPSIILASAPAGYTYAVSVVDRYGNEYTPVVMNQAAQTIAAATLTYPEQNGTPLLPCYFTWKAVDKANAYCFQLSDDNSFAKVLYQYETTAPEFYVGNITFLEGGKTYYWRVRTSAANAKDTYSEVRAFTGKYFNVVSPAEGDTAISLLPLLRCDSVVATDATYLFELAEKATFASDQIVLSETSKTPRFQVKDSLVSSTTHYIRATVTFGGMTVTSSVCKFRTLDLPVPIPEILSPLTGDTIFGTEIAVTWKKQNANGFRVELSKDKNFVPRNTTPAVKEAKEYTHTFTEVEPGTYYIRVKAGGPTGYTTPSPAQTIIVVPATAVDDVLATNCYIAGNRLFAPANVAYSVYTIDGRQIAAGVTNEEYTYLPSVGQGLYIVRIGNQALRYMP